MWTALQAKLTASTSEGALQKALASVRNHKSSDGIAHFSEVDAARGSLGRFPGSEAMPIIKSYLES